MIAISDLLLERYLAGDLSRRQRHDIEERLRNDEVLQKRLALLRQGRAEFLSQNSSSDFARRVQARLVSERPEQKRWWRPLTPALATAALVVLIIVQLQKQNPSLPHAIEEEAPPTATSPIPQLTVQPPLAAMDKTLSPPAESSVSEDDTALESKRKYDADSKQRDLAPLAGKNREVAKKERGKIDAPKTVPTIAAKPRVTAEKGSLQHRELNKDIALGALESTGVRGSGAGVAADSAVGGGGAHRGFDPSPSPDAALKVPPPTASRQGAASQKPSRNRSEPADPEAESRVFAQAPQDQPSVAKEEMPSPKKAEAARESSPPPRIIFTLAANGQKQIVVSGASVATQQAVTIAVTSEHPLYLAVVTYGKDGETEFSCTHKGTARPVKAGENAVCEIRTAARATTQTIAVLWSASPFELAGFWQQLKQNRAAKLNLPHGIQQKNLILKIVETGR